MKPLYCAEDIEVKYHDKLKYILWRPLGGVKQRNWEESFRAGLTQYMSVPDINGWLNDTRLLEYIDGQEIAWTRGYANEKLKEIKKSPKVAFVAPLNKFGAISVDLYVRQTLLDPYNNLNIKIFNDYQSAENWISDPDEK